MEKPLTLMPGIWPGPRAVEETHWRQFGEANARLMNGLLRAWQQQIELGQKLIAEASADPILVTQWFSGSADRTAQWTAAEARFARTIAALRKINDDFTHCLFDVAALASGNGVAGSSGLQRPGPAKGRRTDRGEE